MKPCLRSWKLCEVLPMSLNGIAGWRKRRLRRATLLIPPGNALLTALGSGCRMVGNGWLAHEKNLFRLAHPDLPPPISLDHRTIWLPHLRGENLRDAGHTCNAAISSAFAELGRFHRLGDHAIHGDPHSGNFIYDPPDGRCRLIDFETTVPSGLSPSQARARDFAILALDLWKSFGSPRAPLPLDAWLASYASPSGDFCPVNHLLRDPGPRLATYWNLLGYRRPG